jgi:hypothetical protein
VRSTDSPVQLVARAQVRSRRRSLLTLGALAGITVGLAVAAAGGAFRTDSALDRLRDAENAADAVVFPSQVGAFQPDWDALAERPEVEQIARWGLLFGVVGEGGPEAMPPGPNLLFTSIDGNHLGDMGRPIVTEGRMYDPEAADEVVIDEHTEGVEVGDVIPFTAFGVDQRADAGEATGPSTTFRVVGRVKTIAQFLFTGGQILVAPGYMAGHGDEIQVLENADVRTVRGAADIDALEESVNEVLAPGAPVLDLHEASRRVDTTTAVEHTALFVLTGLILVAGLALVGQAVAQSAAASVDEETSLRAMGLTRAEIVGVATRTHLPAAVVAGATAAVTAAIASIWFPIGVAGGMDPDRGVQVTWWLLVPGVVFVVGALLLGVAVTARFGRRTARTTGPRLSWIRRSTPVPVGLGATMALDPGRGRTAVPTRQALAGATIGVLGVVATVTLSAGLSDALDHPERAGVAWDAAGIAFPDDYTERGIDPALLTAFVEADGVEDVAVVDRQVVAIDGVGTPTFALQPPPGLDESSIDLVLTDGREPADLDEIAIGPATADRLGVGIGDTVSVGPDDLERQVVGEALFPSDVHATFDEGAWMTQPGFEEVVVPFTDPEGQLAERSVVVTFDDDTSVDDGVAALEPVTSGHFDQFTVAEVPPELTNLEHVRTLPIVLAVFLVLLGVSALGHVLATSARRRRQEFAVLRSLGLSRGSTRVVLNVQGTVIGLIGLAVGVPAGIVLGRIGWGLVAESVPIDVVRPVAAVAVLVSIPAALLLANALALWPGHRVARLRPAEVLRSE